MIQCELCGKEVKNTQGLRGHKTFVHRQRTGGRPPSVRMATDEQVEESPSILEQIEGNGTRYTGENTDGIGYVQDSVTRYTEYTNRIKQLEESIASATEYILELEKKIDQLHDKLQSLPTRDETREMTRTVERLEKRVKKHDEWFNPRGVDEVIHGLSGGPIAYIEKRLNDHLAR